MYNPLAVDVWSLSSDQHVCIISRVHNNDALREIHHGESCGTGPSLETVHASTYPVTEQ